MLSDLILNLPSNVPPLPEEVLVLAPDVLEELMDFEHIKGSHGTRTCYGQGCRGPLCRFADRQYSRDRYAAKRASLGKTHTPSDLRRDAREPEFAEALSVYKTHGKIIEVVCRLADIYTEQKETA